MSVKFDFPILWLPVLNESSETVPPYGMMRVTDINDDGVATIDKPNVNDATADILANGEAAIEPGAYGRGRRVDPAICAYMEDVSPYTIPAPGETWGVRAGSWVLHRDRIGYHILGGAGEGLVNAVIDSATGGTDNQGHQGNQGSQGYQGSKGYQGFQSNQGNQGAVGAGGGAQGFQGNQGYQGLQGSQANQGNQGEPGSQGIKGNQGTQGNQGDFGVFGSVGSLWDLDSIADGVPASQKFSTNSAVASAVTTIKIHKDDIFGVDNTVRLVGLMEGDAIRIAPHYGVATPFASVNVNSVTLAANVYTVNATNIGGIGTFVATTRYGIWVSPRGFQGNGGEDGIQGSQGGIGLQGLQGFQSNQGFQGNQGNQGFQGLQSNQGNQGSVGVGGGAQGLQGNQGWQGDRGFQGNQGDRGFQGYQSNQGFQGQGNQGDTGLQGLQSSQGNQGDRGNQGFQGLQGNQGDIGFQGGQGNQGFQGNQGDRGFQGFQGNQGLQSNQGLQGNQGDIGLQGFQSSQGNQGDRGNQGFQGLQGNQGNQGDRGFQGFQSNQGFQGGQGNQGQGFQGNQGLLGSSPMLVYQLATTSAASSADAGTGQFATIRSTGFEIANTGFYLNKTDLLGTNHSAILNGLNTGDLIHIATLNSNLIPEILSEITGVFSFDGTVYTVGLGGNGIGTFVAGTSYGIWFNKRGNQGYQGNQGFQGGQGYQGNQGRQGTAGSIGSYNNVVTQEVVVDFNPDTCLKTFKTFSATVINGLVTNLSFS